MKPLRILLTNWTMAGRHGSVMYVRDLAISLFQHGHRPVVFAPELGAVANELRTMTIPVTGDLRTITEAPDLIIGNANPDLMQALLHFPGIPAVFICHAWDNWLAAPPVFPRLRRYVAVDDTCRDWLVSEKGIPADKVHVIFNAVDLVRFQPRSPLPARAARAAVFSNYLNESLGLGVIREACQRAGLALEVMGEAGGRTAERPEELLGRHDLVFGKARCAMEALAVGCAVIACDYGRLSGMIRTQNWQDLRRMNFGRRAISHPLTVEAVEAEIARYDASDAMEVSRQFRAVAGLDDMMGSLLELGREVIGEQAAAGPPDYQAEQRATADCLRQLDQFKDYLALHTQISRLEAEKNLLRKELRRRWFIPAFWRRWRFRKQRPRQESR